MTPRGGNRSSFPFYLRRRIDGGFFLLSHRESCLIFLGSISDFVTSEMLPKIFYCDKKAYSNLHMASILIILLRIVSSMREAKLMNLFMKKLFYEFNCDDTMCKLLCIFFFEFRQRNFFEWCLLTRI